VNLNVVLPGISSILSFVMAIAVLDQWRTRHRPYQLIWTLGMTWYGIAAGTEFLGGAFGWNDVLYRTWYLAGALWVAGWLGLGTAFLLSRTRFGYAFAAALFFAGLFTALTQAKYSYADSGMSPIVYFAIAALVAVAIAVLTYFGDERWVRVAAALIVGGSIVSAIMIATAAIPAPGYSLDPRTHIPTGDLLPGYVRLLTPFFNVTGGFALVFGAIFSTYIFMPKRRVLHYDLRSDQKGDEFLFNLFISPVAFVVNFAASVPGAVRALFAGRLHSRVLATILIAIGGFIPSITSGANRFGETSPFFVGELLGVVFLFAGFLASIEVFGEFRIPFTARTVRARSEPEEAARSANAAAAEVATGH
jgi:hypothetical protein